MVWAIDIIRILSNIWRMSFNKYTYGAGLAVRNANGIDGVAAHRILYRRAHYVLGDGKAGISLMSCCCCWRFLCHAIASEKKKQIFFRQSSAQRHTAVMLSSR